MRTGGMPTGAVGSYCGGVIAACVIRVRGSARENCSQPSLLQLWHAQSVPHTTQHAVVAFQQPAAKVTSYYLRCQQLQEVVLTCHLAAVVGCW